MPCPPPAEHDLLTAPPRAALEGLTLHYHYEIVSRGQGGVRSPGSPSVEMALVKLRKAAELILRENGAATACRELLDSTRLNLKQLNMMVMDSRGSLKDAEYALLVSVRELINTIEDDEVRLSVVNSDTIARCVGTGAAAEQRRKLVVRLRDKSEARRAVIVDTSQPSRSSSCTSQLHSDHVTMFALRQAQGLKKEAEERKKQWLRQVGLPVKLLHLLLPACRVLLDVHPEQNTYDGILVFFVKTHVVPVHGEEWRESAELCELFMDEQRDETEGDSSADDASEAGAGVRSFEPSTECVWPRHAQRKADSVLLRLFASADPAQPIALSSIGGDAEYKQLVKKWGNKPTGKASSSPALGFVELFPTRYEVFTNMLSHTVVQLVGRQPDTFAKIKAAVDARAPPDKRVLKGAAFPAFDFRPSSACKFGTKKGVWWNEAQMLTDRLIQYLLAANGPGVLGNTANIALLTVSAISSDEEWRRIVAFFGEPVGGIRGFLNFFPDRYELLKHIQDGTSYVRYIPAGDGAVGVNSTPSSSTDSAARIRQTILARKEKQLVGNSLATKKDQQIPPFQPSRSVLAMTSSSTTAKPWDAEAQSLTDQLAHVLLMEVGQHGRVALSCIGGDPEWKRICAVFGKPTGGVLSFLKQWPKRYATLTDARSHTSFSLVEC
ncbi:unnamed protein product [Amoebophrya sp. A120]|nr:unnamed protein product [Amoebophrya sp. A120]|eukprot:GSA120T00001765001.1